MTVFHDAQSALPFVLAQGRNIETQIYAQRYPSFEYASVLPVVTEGNAWAIGTQFMTMDMAGVPSSCLAAPTICLSIRSPVALPRTTSQ